jgi:POTRA domain, FtsQ-type
VSQNALSLPSRRAPTALRLVPPGNAVAIALALVLGGIGMYGLARETSMFAVRTVQVEGAPRPVAAQVRAALRSFDGTSLLSLKGAAVLRRAEELPTVVSASYDRDFPHRLRVRVVPEVPAAVVRQGVSSWLASARGRVIALTDRTRFRSLPRIWLSPSVAVEVGDVLMDAGGGTAARALAVFAAARFARAVRWAHMQHGVLTMGLRTGLELRLGPATDLGLKVAIARRIVPTLIRPSSGGPAYLDLTVPERPVAGTNPQVEG